MIIKNKIILSLIILLILVLIIGLVQGCCPFVEEIKNIMAQQLVNPVKWYSIILKMLEGGIDIFVEVGPKTVLTGLLKKIIPREKASKVYNVQDVESLKGFLKAL